MKNSISNEWAEFLAYTEQPTYSVKNKRDNSFLGRFTMDMITGNYGFARILTIIARGYLFHNPDGTLKDGSPYDRTEYACRALCAWCSIHEKEKTTRKEWQFRTDFRDFYNEFSELVDENGNGWYIRHLNGIVDFINSNRDKVGQSTHRIADSIDKIEDSWRKKVVQYQIPIFSENTKGDKIIRFDDVIADALELGALRSEPIVLTKEQKEGLKKVTPKEVPVEVAETLLEYYLANKPDDSDWCVLPLTNIEAFLGSTALSRLYMKKLNGTVLERKDSVTSACVAKLSRNILN
ncbi:MAG: hypothetical protein MJ168_04850 [Clostridia bacterium]|nr:hypothetical protein [Clostridia bacterium]